MALRNAFAAALLAPLFIACADGDAGESADPVPDTAADTAAADTSRGALPPASAGDSVLTAQGWGPLVIGMTRAQVVAAAGEDANPNAVGGADPEACDQFRPERAPEGMLVMIERDTLTRITISREANVRTDRGFGLGDRAEEIRAAYGSAIEATPHKYVDAPAAYLTTWTTPPGGAQPARGIVYEIGADGRVQHVHAGGPSIQYVEGCS